MRIKNAVDAQSTKKGAAVYFRNSGTDILRAQVKADGFLYLQGGKGTGASRLDIKTVDTAADEFYTYTYDFDFDEQKIYASITDDAGNELAGDDCLVFFADSTRSEAYRKMAPYAAAKVSVKAKIRVDAVESKGVNFYMQDANAFNIARINVMSGAMLLTHGASDGSTNVRTTLIPSIDTEKFYDIELAIDYTKNIFAVLVDQKTVAANMPFMVNASAPGVPVSVLFGANSESAAKLKVARLEIYADAPEISDAEACRVDAAAIDFDASQPLAADFEVAMAGANGTNIEWSSSDDSIISFENGKASVNRPDVVSGDGTVTITATVTRGKNRGER